MPAAQGVVKWPSKLPTLTALVEERELPLSDAAVDRVLLVHALEMSMDAEAMLRDVWRVLAPGGRLLAVIPNRRGIWARTDTTPFGHGRPYSRSQITALLRETWFTPTGWGEALYVPPVDAKLVPALGGRVGARGRDALGAVRRRAHRGSDQAGLSADPGAARAAPSRAGARAGAGAVAWRRRNRRDQSLALVTRPHRPDGRCLQCAGRDGGGGGDAAGSDRADRHRVRSGPARLAVRRR